MQTFDPVLETRILKTLADRPEENLYAVLAQDFFGSPVSREIWDRLQNLKAAGKRFPSSQTLATDPVLGENARTMLGGPLRAYGEHEIESAYDQLEGYRKNRHYFWMLSKVTEICKESSPNHPEAQKILEACLRSVQAPQTQDEVLSYGGENEKVVDLYEKELDVSVEETFIPSGFRQIDKQQGGLSRGRLYTLGANSGGGKSLMANQIAINAYRGKFSVGYVSMELGRAECLFRTQANITKIPHDRFQLKNLSDADRMKSDRDLAEFLSWGETNGVRLDYICPKADMNLPQILAQIEGLNYDLVVIDYINLIAAINPKEGLWWNIGEGFRLMKRFNERNRNVGIMLVQLDDDTGKIKYAQSIRHHSDGVWQWECKEKEIELGVVEINQTKLRNFKPTRFNLKPEFEYCMWSESYGPAVAKPEPVQFKPMRF